MEIVDWRAVTPDEQEVIDDIVRKAAGALRSAGFDAHPPRFPFAMHHDRLRIRLRTNDSKPRHSEVAKLLNRWAAERDFAEAYAWQAVMGAIQELEAKSGRQVPEALKAEAMEGCGGSFEPWAKARIGAAA